MANRIFTKNFHEIRGLNQSQDTLSRTPEYAEIYLNAEVRVDGCTQNRVGEHLCGPCMPYGHGGTWPYNYLDTVTGETKQQLLTANLASIDGVEPLNQYWWKQIQGTFTYSYTGTGTSTFSIEWDSVNQRFVAYARNTLAVTSSFNLGDGASPYASTSKSLGELATWLNGISGWTAKVTPTAVATGQATTNYSTGILVNAGHTFTAGMTIIVQGYYLLITKADATTLWYTAGKDSALGVITAGWVLDSGLGAQGILNPLWVHQGAWLGELTQTMTNGVNAVISVPLWTIVPAFTTGQTNETITIANDGYYNAQARVDRKVFSTVNASNNLYIASPIGYQAASGSADSTRFRGIAKYDSKRILRAGLPNLYGYVQGSAAGGNLTASGTYNFYATIQYKDAAGTLINSSLSGRGIVGGLCYNPITELDGDWLASSQPAPFTSASPATYPTGIYWNSAGTYTVDGSSNVLSKEYWGLKRFAIRTTATGGPSTSWTIHSAWANHKLQVGDAVYYTSTSAHDILTTTITSITPNSVVFADSITLDSSSPYLSLFKVRVWRTTAGGTIYYLDGEAPLAGDLSYSCLNSPSDLTLSGKEQLVIPLDTRQADPPRTMRAIASHQGLLVGLGHDKNPNTAYYSTSDGPEYMPWAYNSIDVPSTVQGPLSAIASDSDGMLMVAKPTALYNITGDLDTASFSIATVTENDVGCPAQAAICKVAGKLIFPSYVGFIIYNNGQFDRTFGQALYQTFTGNQFAKVYGQAVPDSNTKLTIDRATAVHDTEKQQYICFLPTDAGTYGTSFASGQYSKTFAYQYARQSWTEISSPAVTMGGHTNQYANAGGGFYVSQGQVFSVADRVYGTIGVTRNTYGTVQDYKSGAYVLPFTYRGYWEHLGEPSLAKMPLQVKVYSFGDGALVAYSLRLRTYIDYDGTNVHSDRQLAFPNNGYYAVARLNNCQCRSVLIQLSNDLAAGTVPSKIVISGYEIIFDAPYANEEPRP